MVSLKSIFGQAHNILVLITYVPPLNSQVKYPVDLEEGGGGAGGQETPWKITSCYMFP